MVMQRGSIWWANLPPPSGYRPVVLISRNNSIERRELVTVAILTGRIRGIPVEVKVGQEEGLTKQSVINCDVIRTISKTDLKKYISLLSPSKINDLNQAITFALGLYQSDEYYAV